MWIDFEIEAPKNGQIIDVFVAYPDEDSGHWKGYRITNCWFDGNQILHGKTNIPIKGATHWMKVPADPPIRPYI